MVIFLVCNFLGVQLRLESEATTLSRQAEALIPIQELFHRQILQLFEAVP